MMAVVAITISRPRLTTPGNPASGELNGSDGVAVSRAERGIEEAGVQAVRCSRWWDVPLPLGVPREVAPRVAEASTAPEATDATLADGKPGAVDPRTGGAKTTSPAGAGGRSRALGWTSSMVQPRDVT